MRFTLLCKMYLRFKGFGVTKSGKCLVTSFPSKPKPFDMIPGPKSLPIIGTLYKYFPGIGEYSFKRLDETGKKKYARYGPLVREEIVPGVNTVWVFRPEDINEIFKSEVGENPERRSHLALYKYRKDRGNVYRSGGLLPTNGPDWWRIRKEFQKALSKHRNIVNYIGRIDNVIEKFVELCGEKKHDDLLSLLSRLSLELICLVAFDVAMKSFSEEEMRENSTTSKLIEAAFTSNSASLVLDNGPRLWRFFNTPLYKNFCKSQEVIKEVALEMVQRKINEIKERTADNEESLLAIYLKNENLDVKDVVGMACDMLLAGIDTMAYSTAFALYHVAKNQLVQQKLQQEALNLMPRSNDSITSLRDAIYTKAVIKESFRLNPISVGVGRILKSDTILNGYIVPAGTNVVTQNQIICQLPEFFSDPEAFIPERWVRDDAAREKNVHPYLVLPFGHGQRSCIARRLAEQNMQMVLLKVLRAYSLKWKGGSLEIMSSLINRPASPVSIEFSPWGPESFE